MTEYQLMILRYLQARRDFPNLRHEGHGPKPTVGSLSIESDGFASNFQVWDGNLVAKSQREDAEREFRRSDGR